MLVEQSWQRDDAGERVEVVHRVVQAVHAILMRRQAGQDRGPAVGGTGQRHSTHSTRQQLKYHPAVGGTGQRH